MNLNDPYWTGAIYLADTNLLGALQGGVGRKARQVQGGENFVSGNLAKKRNQVGGEHLKHGAGI